VIQSAWMEPVACFFSNVEEKREDGESRERSFFQLYPPTSVTTDPESSPESSAKC